jgi:hypothetical protein
MKIRFRNLSLSGSLSCLPVGTNLRSLVYKSFFPCVLLVWLGLFAYAQHTSFMVGKKNSQSEVYTGNSGSASLRRAQAFEHAIIVAGHSVMRLNQMQSAERDERSWYLLNYQIGQDFPAIISSHVRKGIELARDDEKSILIFSGGQTRVDVGPTSEAASYYYLAQQSGWVTDVDQLNRRIFLEGILSAQ